LGADMGGSWLAPGERWREPPRHRSLRGRFGSVGDQPTPTVYPEAARNFSAGGRVFHAFAEPAGRTSGEVRSGATRGASQTGANAREGAPFGTEL